MQEAFNQDLFQLLEKSGSNRAERELLVFWSRHPNAKFGRSAILYAFDYNKSLLERALKAQVEAKLVEVSSEHGQSFFSLTTDRAKRQPVLALSALHWGQFQSMLDSMDRKGGARVSARVSSL